MSLKVFHIVFISACLLLAAGVGVGYFRVWFSHGGTGNLLAGLGGFAAAAALVTYETWFLRKARRLS